MTSRSFLEVQPTGWDGLVSGAGARALVQRARGRTDQSARLCPIAVNLAVLLRQLSKFAEFGNDVEHV